MISHHRRWLGFGLVAMAALVVATREVAAQEVIDAKAAAYLRDRISQTWTPCTSRSWRWPTPSRRTSTPGVPLKVYARCPRC